MKPFVHSFGFILLLSLTFCKETDIVDPTKPKADFNYTLNGEAPNAELILLNNSINSTSYTWKFSAGAGILLSIEENPSPLSLKRAGQFEVTLIAQQDNRKDSLTTIIDIPGHNSIRIYSNIKFSRNSNLTGYLFSFDFINNETYFTQQTSQKSTDLVFTQTQDNYVFQNPQLLNITNGRNTILNHHPEQAQYLLDTYRSMIDDRFIDTLSITTNTSLLSINELPHVITFQLQDNRKGFIITTLYDDTSLNADIVIQEYN